MTRSRLYRRRLSQPSTRVSGFLDLVMSSISFSHLSRLRWAPKRVQMLGMLSRLVSLLSIVQYVKLCLQILNLLIAHHVQLSLLGISYVNVYGCLLLEMSRVRTTFSSVSNVLGFLMSTATRFSQKSRFEKFTKF